MREHDGCDNPDRTGANYDRLIARCPRLTSWRAHALQLCGLLAYLLLKAFSKH